LLIGTQEQLKGAFALNAHIRYECAEDAIAVEAVCAAAFGPGRHAKVSARVRERARLNLALSQVAVLDGAIAGCCRIYDVSIGASPALFLGPLAVHPHVQAGGLGRALIAAAIGACDAHTCALLVVGQPRLFEPFGFARAPEGRVLLPGPVEARRFQWRACGGIDLTPLAGVVSPPRAAN
jgi:predicted N-acetyltransferase YhbS